MIPIRTDRSSEKIFAENRQMLEMSGDRNKALIIEDDPKALAMIRKSLMTEGYNILTSPDGKEGIETAKKDAPDLIVLDLMMPGISGFEVIDELRADEKTALIPVIILTAMDLSPEDKKKLQDKVRYIAEKGCLTEEDFITLIKRVVENRGGICG